MKRGWSGGRTDFSKFVRHEVYYRSNDATSFNLSILAKSFG